MIRFYPIFLVLLLSLNQLCAKEVAGIDMDSLERPSGISLSSQDILQEQRAKRNVRAALRLISAGEIEANTEDDFSKLLNRTIDKSDVREAGQKKIAEGEAMLKKAASELQEIYTAAQNRAELTFEARNSGMLHEWTSTDGRTLSASFVRMSAGVITVRTGDGTEYNIPMDRLVERDWSVAKILETGRGFNTVGFLETVASGNTAELDYFIAAGFQPPPEIHGEAFLQCVALEQSSAMLETLIDHGLNVNSYSADGSTALSQAVQAGKLPSVRILLQAGADPLLCDTQEPALSPIVWSLHKWDPVITALLFLESEERLDGILASLGDFVNTEYFKPISVEKAQQLQEIVNGKELPYTELEKFRLSLLGLEMNINDLEKVMIAKELRPLVISYHALGYYRHTIRRNQEYIDSLIDIWDKQHEAGKLPATYTLALAHLDGWGAIGVRERTEDYLNTAIKGEHTPSMILMGEIFEEGLLGTVDAFKAYDLYRQAAGLSDPLGMVKLGHCFENGISIERDLSKAITWYERSIENGSTEGMAQLGRCYLEGIGVRKNAILGLEWYTKAAEANNPSAMFFLGRELLIGQEIRKNVSDGIEWLKRAAEFGELDALLPLGIAYSDGTVKKDLELANAYFKEAAERGDLESMYRLANNLRDGAGVPQNKEKAFEWYGMAAAKNHLDSINQLAVCYSSGSGVAQDQRQAYNLFKKAASLGHMQATANLAICYAKGLGVSVDKEESARLELQVRNSNDEEAKNILKILQREEG